MSNEIKQLISQMYNDRLPLPKFVNMPKDFKLPRSTVTVRLFMGEPATPEDSIKMETCVKGYIDMMVLAEVLSETKVPDSEDTILGPGRMYKAFVDEVIKYCDADSIIIRTLKISRQEYDQLVKEYVDIMGKVNDLDSILESWQELPMDTKMGILRGVFMQRTIMADILKNAKNRLMATQNYNNSTMQWIDALLGGKPAEAEDKDD